MTVTVTEAVPSAAINATVLAIFAAVAVGYVVFLVQARAQALVEALNKAAEVNERYAWPLDILPPHAPYNGRMRPMRTTLAGRIARVIKGQADPALPSDASGIAPS